MAARPSRVVWGEADIERSRLIGVWRRLTTAALVVSFVISALQLSAATALASTPVAGSGFGFSSYTYADADLVGLAFQPVTGALFATDEGGQLWSVPPGGGTPTPLGPPILKNPRGVTFGLDGKMYIARYDNGTNTGAGDVIEVDPGTGAILRVVVSKGCVDGIATEPATGDLIITSCRQMWRVVAPGSGAPTIVNYAAVFNAHAIQISPSGQVFVNAPVNATSCVASCSSDRSEIWDVTGGTAQSVKNIPGTNGLALVGIIATPTGSFPHFVFTNSTGGDVQKVNLDTAGPNLPVLDADDGDVMTIGPDNCLYAIHDGTVHRISKSDGTCDLETAGETVPAFSLSAPSGTQHTGSPYTITATLNGIVVDPATLVVLFDVTGENAQTGLPGTWIGGSAVVGWAKWSVTYTGTNMGADVVTASTSHHGLPVTSDPLPVVWGPAADVTPPVVKVKVTGPHGTTGFACAALDAFVEIAVAETCGFFTGAPTVQWQISEPESPATLTGICPTQTLNYPSPATGTPFTCSVGGEGGSTQKTVVLQTAPVAPEVTVVAKTASGAPYAAGTSTRETVTVEFTCKAAYGPPFMSCGSAGATFGAPTVVIPPAPPGGCTTVACLPYTIVKATHVLAADGTFNVAASLSDSTARSDSETFGPVIIDKTAPVVTATPSRAPDLNGWYSADVTLTWSCADLGAIVTGCAVVGAASQLVAAEGDHLYGKTAQDGVGNTGTGSFQVKLDKTAPTVTASATANGAPYTAGALTRFDVVVTFTCTDNIGGSGVAAADCPAPQTFTSSQAGVTSGPATDRAGNVGAPATFGPIQIDNTPPTISAGAPMPNAYGWYGASVVVTFTCGLDAVSCTAPVTLTAEGLDVIATGTATDAAGNDGTATKSVRIDRTAPLASASVSAGQPMSDGRYSMSATVRVVGTDVLSGVASVSYEVITQPYTDDAKTVFGPAIVTTPLTTVAGSIADVLVDPEGLSTISFVVTDRAGNTVSGSFVVTVVDTIPTGITVTTRTLADGTVEATAIVSVDGGAAFVPAGHVVTFSAGAATVGASVGTNGRAVAIITGLVSGQYTVSADFAQQLPYLASSASARAIAAQPTSFVIWGANAGGVQVGQRAQFWGAAWTKQVVGGKAAFKANSSFKGWGGTLSGTSWSTKGGNTTEPKTVGSYITVLVTTATDKDGRADRGNVAGYAVLRVEDPARFAANPGHDAYGQVVQTGP